jgi:peptidoglycan hydrolase-like protein with peptidoglycan-binding domain
MFRPLIAHALLRALLATTALVPGAAWSEDVALILGTGAYQSIEPLRGAAAVADAAGGLADLGFEVIAVPNGSTQETSAALRQFTASLPDAERIVVALSGRFATDGLRTWFLSADSTTPGILSLGAGAVPVESLLTILSRAQGRALLLLGTDPDADTVFDPWLREGIGALEVPQGVTVLTGPPGKVAAFMKDELVVPQGDLGALVTRNGDLQVQGFLPPTFRFMPDSPDSELPVAPTEVPVVNPAIERALWEGTVALDTVEAYRTYIARFPTGVHVAEAQAAIRTIQTEPNRQDRLAEESLNLSRDQRREIQQNLTLLEFNTRGIDGIFGSATRSAITNWQQQNGYSQTSYLTAEQISRLDAQAARRSAQIEAEAARQQQIAAAADRAFWDETGAHGDEAGLRAYINRYPDGLFAQTAKRQLETIEANKRQQAQAADRAAWDAARQTDTIRAYRIYLRDFPQGAFAGDAQARIDRLAAQDDNAANLQGAAATEAALGIGQVNLSRIERRLDQLGLEPGTVDGVLDDNSRRALRNYQQDRGLTVSGYLDEQTVVLLFAEAMSGQ